MAMPEIPEEVRADLKRRANVVGVGWGPKRRGGQATEEMCVVVFVQEKVPESELAAADVCPPTVRIGDEDVLTDVVEVGEVESLATGVEHAGWLEVPDRTGRHRPAPASVSTGHPAVTAGTLGSPPLVTEDDVVVFLTNAHVAAPAGAEPGDPCLQPGPADGGTAEDDIGVLAEYSPISGDASNTSDSAVVAVDGDALVANEILEIGPLVGWAEPEFGSRFEKSGRTTGFTRGLLVARDVEIEVAGYEPGTVTFTGVDAFTPMGLGGDSGSLIGTHADGFHATDLLFAGSPFITFGIPLGAVEEVHGELAIAHPPDPPTDDPNPSSRSLLERIIDFLRKVFKR